jgi:hypothetical protein
MDSSKGHRGEEKEQEEPCGDNPVTYPHRACPYRMGRGQSNKDLSLAFSGEKIEGVIRRGRSAKL